MNPVVRVHVASVLDAQKPNGNLNVWFYKKKPR